MQKIAGFSFVELNPLNLFEKSKLCLLKGAVITAVALIALSCLSPTGVGFFSVYVITNISFLTLSSSLRSDNLTVFKMALITHLILFTGFFTAGSLALSSGLVQYLGNSIGVESIRIFAQAALIIGSIEVLGSFINERLNSVSNVCTNVSDELLKNLRNYYKKIPVFPLEVIPLNLLSLGLFSTKDFLTPLSPIEQVLHSPTQSLVSLKALCSTIFYIIGFKNLKSYYLPTFSFFIENLTREEMTLFIEKMTQNIDKLPLFPSDFFQTPNFNKSLHVIFDEIHAEIANFSFDEIYEPEVVEHKLSKVSHLLTYYLFFSRLPQTVWKKEIDVALLKFSEQSRLDQMQNDLLKVSAHVLNLINGNKLTINDLSSSYNNIQKNLIACIESNPKKNEIEDISLQYLDFRKKVENLRSSLEIFKFVIIKYAEDENFDFLNVFYSKINEVYSNIIKSGTIEKPSLSDYFQKMNNLFNRNLEMDEEEDPFSPAMHLAYPPINFVENDYEILKKDLQLHPSIELDQFLLEKGLDSAEKINQIMHVDNQLKDQWKRELSLPNLSENWIRKISQKHHLKTHESFRIICMLKEESPETIRQLLLHEIIKAEMRHRLIQHFVKNKPYPVAQLIYRMIMAGTFLVPALISPIPWVGGVAVGTVYFGLQRFGLCGKIDGLLEGMTDFFNRSRIVNLTKSQSECMHKFENAGILFRIRTITTSFFWSTTLSFVPTYASFKGFALSKDLIASE